MCTACTNSAHHQQAYIAQHSCTTTIQTITTATCMIHLCIAGVEKHQWYVWVHHKRTTLGGGGWGCIRPAACPCAPPTPPHRGWCACTASPSTASPSSVLHTAMHLCDRVGIAPGWTPGWNRHPAHVSIPTLSHKCMAVCVCHPQQLRVWCASSAHHPWMSRVTRLQHSCVRR